MLLLLNLVIIIRYYTYLTLYSMLRLQISSSSPHPVTAMKTGYDNSDVATAKLYWLTSSGSLEGASINNVSMRGIAIQSAGGFINISGLDNNIETVSFYALDGKTLGTAKSIDGNVLFSGKQAVVVVRIGKESIKISVK